MYFVRPPAVADSFYSGQDAVLSADVLALLTKAERTDDANSEIPKAIIVPPAGYVYSGSTTAVACSRLLAGRKTIRHTAHQRTAAGSPTASPARAIVETLQRWRQGLDRRLRFFYRCAKASG